MSTWRRWVGGTHISMLGRVVLKTTPSPRLEDRGVPNTWFMFSRSQPLLPWIPYSGEISWGPDVRPTSLKVRDTCLSGSPLPVWTGLWRWILDIVKFLVTVFLVQEDLPGSLGKEGDGTPVYVVDLCKTSFHSPSRVLRPSDLKWTSFVLFRPNRFLWNVQKRSRVCLKYLIWFKKPKQGCLSYTAKCLF